MGTSLFLNPNPMVGSGATSLAPDAAMPPMRQGPDDTAKDGDRVAYFHRLWNRQTPQLLARDRMIEENARMLEGAHWDVWHPTLNRHVDISQFLSDAEKRWRQRPVVNYLLRWFMLTHARMTENPPIVTWNPGPDARDADLAEALTFAQKVIWRDANMDDVVYRMMAWLIVAGSVYTLSRLDPDVGVWVPVTATVPVPIVAPDGSVRGMTPQPMEVPVTNRMEPAMGVQLATGQLAPLPNVQPKMRRQGQIAVDVLTPLEVRGEWGPKPWGQKSWHAVDLLYSPDDLKQMWGVDIEPTRSTDATDRRNRVLRSAGIFGAMTGQLGMNLGMETPQDTVPVRVFWFRQRAGHPELGDSPENPGGRYVALSGERVLYDGPRPIAFPYTSPIHRWDFVHLPSRASGTTPQEALNGLNRASNKVRAIIMENANLTGSPKAIIDEASGIDPQTWSNAPGEAVSANMRQGVEPAYWMNPPQVGESVYATLSQTHADFQEIGNLEGGGGKSPTRDASGELVRELRYNEDRYYGPTLRRAVPEFGRMFQTWRAMMPLIYDRETILSMTGSDRIVQTLMIYPELFQTGTVDAEPDLDSMLPEGRGERRARVQWMYENGMFGPPGSPEAIAQYMERSRFPHDSRVLVPAHLDWQTAQAENAELAKGADPRSIPILPWYDQAVHIAAIESVMKRREFLKFPPNIQQGFIMHRQLHIMELQKQQLRQAKNAPPPPQEPPEHEPEQEKSDAD